MGSGVGGTGVGSRGGGGVGSRGGSFGSAGAVNGESGREFSFGGAYLSGDPGAFT